MILREISQYLEKTCSESVDTGIKILTPLNNDLQERLAKPEYSVASVDVEAVKTKKKKKDKKVVPSPEAVLINEGVGAKDDTNGAADKEDSEATKTADSATEGAGSMEGEEGERKVRIWKKEPVQMTVKTKNIEKGKAPMKVVIVKIVKRKRWEK